MERDLGLKPGPSIPSREKGLLESLQGIDPAIINRFLGPVQKEKDEGDYDDEPENPTAVDSILEMIKDNPKLVEKYAPAVLKGLGGKGEETEGNYL